MIKVLFVCLGNICRSPTAHGIFEEIVKKARFSKYIKVDSAGIGSWHINKNPDQRAIDVALKEGYDLSYIKARQINEQDFEEQDYILGMDRENIISLLKICPDQHKHKIHLLMSYIDESSKEVIDPYFGNNDGFLDMFKKIKKGCHAFFDLIKNQIYFDK